MKTLSELVAEHESPLLDDRGFITKLTLLLILIVFLSLYLIFSGVQLTKGLDEYPHSRSLKEVEQQINGKSVTLDVAEDEFSDLEAFERQMENLERVSYPKEEKRVSRAAVHRSTNTKKRILITSSHVDSFALLKKRFQRSHNPVYSMALAKRLYKRKAYKKALKWALITNEIDHSNEESWILFAKAKVKLHQKKDAINALMAYLQMQDSSKVRAVLNDIVKNRI